MKIAIQQIDQAIKDIYAIDSPHRAVDFLLTPRPTIPQGAVFVKAIPATNDHGQEMELGICLNTNVAKTLNTYNTWGNQPWSTTKLSAFSVAVEEISHFRCLIFNVSQGRPISEFELEFQAEIDKFLVLYFTGLNENGNRIQWFDHLFDSLFEHFRLASGLDGPEVIRYQDASQSAKNVILNLREELGIQGKVDLALQFLRKFYRLNQTDKFTFSRK